MTHRFVLIVNGEQVTYHNYEDIPEQFDHIIEFVPYIPDPPHTEEQHNEIEKWNEKLKELIKKENQQLENNYASSN